MSSKRKDGTVVAIKIIDLEQTSDDIDTINREIQALVGACFCSPFFKLITNRRFRCEQINAKSCPQLTTYYGSLVYGTKLWIVMEYVDGGSVLDRVSANPLITIKCTEIDSLCVVMRAVEDEAFGGERDCSCGA